MTKDAFRTCIQAIEEHFGRKVSNNDQRQKLLARTFSELADEDDAALIAAGERLMLSCRSLPALQELIDAVRQEGKARRIKAGDDLERDADQYRHEAVRHENVLTNPPPGNMMKDGIKALNLFSNGAITRREFLQLQTALHKEYPGCGWDRAQADLHKRWVDSGKDLDGYNPMAGGYHV